MCRPHHNPETAQLLWHLLAEDFLQSDKQHIKASDRNGNTDKQKLEINKFERFGIADNLTMVT